MAGLQAVQSSRNLQFGGVIAKPQMTLSSAEQERYGKIARPICGALRVEVVTPVSLSFFGEFLDNVARVPRCYLDFIGSDGYKIKLGRYASDIDPDLKENEDHHRNSTLGVEDFTWDNYWAFASDSPKRIVGLSEYFRGFKSKLYRRYSERVEKDYPLAHELGHALYDILARTKPDFLTQMMAGYEEDHRHLSEAQLKKFAYYLDSPATLGNQYRLTELFAESFRTLCSQTNRTEFTLEEFESAFPNTLHAVKKFLENIQKQSGEASFEVIA
jgi:hypothetical protein